MPASILDYITKVKVQSEKLQRELEDCDTLIEGTSVGRLTTILCAPKYRPVVNEIFIKRMTMQKSAINFAPDMRNIIRSCIKRVHTYYYHRNIFN